MRDTGVSLLGMFSAAATVATTWVENANHWLAFVGGLLFLLSTLLAIIHSVRALFKGKHERSDDQGD
jgi:UDP-N-acetylmuramyl pentapeptide phosphotransferase/UDP-N-acetylglucosamine-1-phosphate transferase